MPKLHSASIIGYRSNGSPIREIRGGSQQAAESGDQSQQAQTDDLDLLGGEAEDQGQGDDQTGSTEGPPAWWAAAQAAIVAQTQSEIDRRINQLTNPKGGRNQHGQFAGTQQQQADPPAATGPDKGEILYARSVARDTLNDSGLRLSPAERKLVNTMTPGAIRAALDQNPDPDQVGADVGRRLADVVKELRQEHQSSIISQLERRGALDRSKLKPGQAQQQGGDTPPQSKTGDQYKAGQDKAAEMAARMGRKVPGQTN